MYSKSIWESAINIYGICIIIGCLMKQLMNLYYCKFVYYIIFVSPTIITCELQDSSYYIVIIMMNYDDVMLCSLQYMKNVFSREVPCLSLRWESVNIPEGRMSCQDHLRNVFNFDKLKLFRVAMLTMFQKVVVKENKLWVM